jgi:hypothetical protein
MNRKAVSNSIENGHTIYVQVLFTKQKFFEISIIGT